MLIYCLVIHLSLDIIVKEAVVRSCNAKALVTNTLISLERKLASVQC